MCLLAGATPVSKPGDLTIVGTPYDNDITETTSSMVRKIR